MTDAMQDASQQFEKAVLSIFKGLSFIDDDVILSIDTCDYFDDGTDGRFVLMSMKSGAEILIELRIGQAIQISRNPPPKPPTQYATLLPFYR